MGIEPICDQLLFLQGISLRRYTTILPTSERQDLNLRPPAPKAGALPTAPLSDLRKMRDSNPRYLSVCWFSRPVHSTTLPIFRWATNRTRTYDRLITNQMLYQLSYGGYFCYSSFSGVRFTTRKVYWEKSANRLRDFAISIALTSAFHNLPSSVSTIVEGAVYPLTWVVSTLHLRYLRFILKSRCIIHFYSFPLYLVTPLGLEPRTLSLKVRCSNQLSYEVELWVVRDSNPRPSRCKRDALNQLS